MKAELTAQEDLEQEIDEEKEARADLIRKYKNE